MTALKRLLFPGLAALVALDILVSLGVWQLYRLQWKEALIARVTSRLAAPPIPAPGPEAWRGLDVAGLEYQPVALRGHYHNDREVDVVYTLTEPHGPRGGVGYLVMTPFETDAGWYVYVDRGFVPADRKSAASRTEGLIEGATTVIGLVRRPHGRIWYMPGDNIAANQWFSRDPDLYARTYGLPPDKVAPYLVDARFDPALPGGLPQGGETIIDFPNSHLQYAITWFGLAAGLIGVFTVFARRRLQASA